MKKSIFLVLAFLVFSCHQPAKKYTQEEAEAQVLALPMVQEASKHIDKITNGKHGISFITRIPGHLPAHRPTAPHVAGGSCRQAGVGDGRHRGGRFRRRH